MPLNSHPKFIVPPSRQRSHRDAPSLKPVVIVALIALVLIGGGALLLRRASQRAIAAEAALLDQEAARRARLLEADRKQAARTPNQDRAPAPADHARISSAPAPATRTAVPPRDGMPLRLTPGRTPIELSQSSEPASAQGAAPPPPDPSTLKLDAQDRAGISLPPEALDELERRGLLQY